MNHSPRGVHCLTHCQIARLGPNRVAKGPCEDVDTLLVVRMTVRWRNVGAGRHSQLEHAETRGLRTIDDVADAKLAHFDLGSGHGIPQLVEYEPASVRWRL